MASAPARLSPEGGSVASRTQIVCLHEGEAGRSIDPIFITRLMKALNPAWVRHGDGSNIVRTVSLGGRTTLIQRMPGELRSCLEMGGHTTLMVWADLDHDMKDGDQLKEVFWRAAEQAGITKDQFDQVVFVFAKDRLENWIEFLLNGATDDSKSAPKRKHDRLVADAARSLAERCLSGTAVPKLPPSLAWSCRNWRTLVARMGRDTA